MPQNIFKIYDGRTSFWQWDTKQKLIVLDDRITEVRFSNRDMEHSKSRQVYVNDKGERVCNIPDLLLQLPKNLIAYACMQSENGGCSTVKAVKFAVLKQPIPTDYVCEQDDDIEERLTQIDIKLDYVNEHKADNLYYDADNQCVQLTANGEPIGDPVEISTNGACSIDNFEINTDGHLIVTLSDGRVIDAGYVGINSGVTFTPHISEDHILSWTNNGGLENPEPVDLNPFDEWSTLPEEGIETEYEWEFI